jgi:DNA-binding transcriptional LysR family regulator
MHASVLKYFAEVARSGSVRKASENLHVAASAVNRQILKLEDELGTELFDRFPNGMRLNSAGERLLKHIQLTLHDFQTVRTDLQALKGERTGHVKVAALDSLFEDFLPSAVEEFTQLFPAVTYTLTSAHPVEVPTMVLSGRVDAGLTFIGRLPAGLQAVALASMPIGVVMPPGHPFSAKKAITLAECATQPFLRTGGQHVGASVSDDLARFWDELEPVATCNWTPLIKRLLIAGKGIAIYSKIAFIDELRRGEIVWRPLSLPAAQTKIGIVVPGQRVLPAVTQNFVGRMARRLKQIELAAAAL